MTTKEALSVRAASRDLIAAIDDHRDQEQALHKAITGVLDTLMERPDLLTLGVNRNANHIPWSSYLYYDGELSLTVNYLPKGAHVPVHDHGVWEALAVYRGGIEHQTYHRADRDERPGHAELQLLERSTMRTGDLHIVAPPDDIHGFEALAEDTYFLAAYLNHFKPDRHYYQPEQGTYLLRDQKAWRASN